LQAKYRRDREPVYALTLHVPTEGLDNQVFFIGTQVAFPEAAASL